MFLLSTIPAFFCQTTDPLNGWLEVIMWSPGFKRIYPNYTEFVLFLNLHWTSSFFSYSFCQFSSHMMLIYDTNSHSIQFLLLVNITYKVFKMCSFFQKKFDVNKTRSSLSDGHPFVESILSSYGHTQKCLLLFVRNWCGFFVALSFWC